MPTSTTGIRLPLMNINDTCTQLQTTAPSLLKLHEGFGGRRSVHFTHILRTSKRHVHSFSRATLHLGTVYCETSTGAVSTDLHAYSLWLGILILFVRLPDCFLRLTCRTKSEETEFPSEWNGWLEFAGLDNDGLKYDRLENDGLGNDWL